MTRQGHHKYVYDGYWMERRYVRGDYRAPYPTYGLRIHPPDTDEYASVSISNSKLRDIVIWNIPAGNTCPGATEGCLKFCYASRGYAEMARDARERNWEFSERDDFVHAFLLFLQYTDDNPLLPEIKYVRIHEAGDFYSDVYLDKWFEIARGRPDLIFYAYTRSYGLFPADIKIPDNMVIRYSVDPTTQHLPEYLSIAELCAFLGIGRGLGYDLVRSGTLPGVRFGRLLRVPKSALLTYAERND